MLTIAKTTPKSRKKIDRTPTLDQNTVTCSLQFSGVVCPCSRAKRDSVTKLIEIQAPPRSSSVTVRVVAFLLDSHPRLRDSDRFTGLFNRASKRRADTNDAAQTQTFNNPPPIPSAPQTSRSASQLPLTTNITNIPVAGPSISHNFTFSPAPLNHHHFGFYPTNIL